MAGNTFGSIFRVTTFGESHGAGIGVVIDGCPAGVQINFDEISRQLNRRRPGQNHLMSARNEHDSFEILSGVFEGHSTGAPISIFVKNNDQKSSDYNHLKGNYRPGHADYSTSMKYGIRDHRGGGRSSARETLARVIAGSIAKSILDIHQISVTAYVMQIGSIKCDLHYSLLDLTQTENSIVRCPEPTTSNKMVELIENITQQGDSIGGIISCIVKHAPVGLGEPVFDKLHADLAKAMLSINAVKGFEIGDGFAGVQLKGSEYNDIFTKQTESKLLTTSTNHSGGIQGGISNGQDIVFNVAFKPVSTIMQTQSSIDEHGNKVELAGVGRHDACVLPRAVPIVEAMTNIVLVDHLLRNRSAKIN